MDHIYLDHAAATPVDKRVLEAMYPIYEDVFGNPSSIHSFGRTARRYLDEARSVLAKSIHASEKEIIFTSGGTEADNLALIGIAMANRDKGNHIITTEQEHHAALRTAEYLAQNGFDVTFLPVYADGRIRADDVKKALRHDTILVSIMLVNNETGIMQPLKEIGELLEDHSAYLHTDAVQAYGSMEINVKELKVDMLSVSAHKINGPKGIGFLYAAANVKINAIQFGGEQEKKRRAGTENLAGATGFKRAVELVMELREERTRMYQEYKQQFLNVLKTEQIDFQINGDIQYAIASTVNISFPGTNAESLLMNFDLDGIAASSGSACTAGSVEPSHVLKAIYGSEDARLFNSIRFSFGSFNTTENVIEAGLRVAKIVKRLTE